MALNYSWKQYFSAVTSVTNALEVFFPLLTYVLANSPRKQPVYRQKSAIHTRTLSHTPEVSM